MSCVFLSFYLITLCPLRCQGIIATSATCASWILEMYLCMCMTQQSENSESVTSSSVLRSWASVSSSQQHLRYIKQQPTDCVLILEIQMRLHFLLSSYSTNKLLCEFYKSTWSGLRMWTRVPCFFWVPSLFLSPLGIFILSFHRYLLGNTTGKTEDVGRMKTQLKFWLWNRLTWLLPLWGIDRDLLVPDKWKIPILGIHPDYFKSY